MRAAGGGGGSSGGGGSGGGGSDAHLLTFCRLSCKHLASPQPAQEQKGRPLAVSPDGPAQARGWLQQCPIAAI